MAANKKKKKILILANNDVGLYQFRKEFIAELLRENNVSISLPYGSLVENLKKDGCKFVDTPLDRRGTNLVKDIKLFNNYVRLLKNEKPDIVITYTIKPNIYGGYACRLAKIPYVVNITGLGSVFQESSLLRKIAVIMYKIALKKVSIVFFENKENKKTFFDEKIIEPEKGWLLNGAGVNTEHFIRTSYPNEGKIKFLFIGRVMKEKGINELFLAMDKLWKDGIKVELGVLGKYEENYKDIISMYEEVGWLKYYGYQKDVRVFIADAHCLVLPSWHEGMANANLEAAASGRPVITSNVHGCLEAVKDGISGYLVAKGDDEDLYRVMKKFVQLPYEEKSAMGIAGRKYMEDVFDKRKVVKDTIDILRQKVL